jgi:hypothetical protein
MLEINTVYGYAVFDSNWEYQPEWEISTAACEVGKKYDIETYFHAKPIGFLIYKSLSDCVREEEIMAEDNSKKIAEVIASGKISSEKNSRRFISSGIEIVSEITPERILEILNTGENNKGIDNTGDCNSGNKNTGSYNSGNKNTGNRNSGNQNTGDDNSGHCNVGNGNPGNFCVGDYNASSFVVGCFNTEVGKLSFFDSPSDISYNEWHESEAYKLLKKVNLSPLEWIEYDTIGGFLKAREIENPYKEWWDKLTREERIIIRSIPNFDQDKFWRITGVKAEVPYYNGGGI